eukprot:346728_1
MAAAGSDDTDTFFEGWKEYYKTSQGSGETGAIVDLCKAFARYWMAEDKNKAQKDEFVSIPIASIVRHLIGTYHDTETGKTFTPGTFGVKLNEVQGGLAEHTFDAIETLTTEITESDKDYLAKASDTLFVQLRDSMLEYTTSGTGGESKPSRHSPFMLWLNHVGDVFCEKKYEEDKRAKCEAAWQRRVDSATARTRSGATGAANSEYYNELEVFDDSFRYPHHSHHSLPFDGPNHYQPFISGEYNDVSGSESSFSSLFIGGVVGASAVVIILLVFCLGLVFGMSIYWGYSQKTALDVKRKKVEMRNWIDDDEDRNEV